MKNKILQFKSAFLLVLMFLITIVIHHKILAQDSLALVAFYNSTNGDDWTNKENWLVPGQPISTWRGIKMDEDGRVKEIGFISNNLTGTIPPEIGNLTGLKSLIIISNNIGGELPEELGSLGIRTIRLGSNNFVGEIPLGLWSKTMRIMYLGYNQFTGEIPMQIGEMTRLQELNIGHNLLSGTIPDGIGNLTKLFSCHLEYNDFSGELPSSMGNMAWLNWLNLSSNNFVGVIPPEFANLKMSTLNLSHNQLTGQIPNIWEINNQSMSYLDLSSNLFTGELPPDVIANRQMLLNNNNFLGCFPLSYAKFCNKDVDFSNNPGLPNDGDFDAFCVDFTGVCGSSIIGRVVYDENENCDSDISEISMKKWLVIASSTSTTETHFGYSNDHGYYGVPVSPGEFDIIAKPPNDLWSNSCDGSTVNIENDSSVESTDLYAKIETSCPLLTVEIASPRSRRCFSTYYIVEYCNTGTESAENVQVKVTFNPLFNIESSSQDYTVQEDNVYIFDIGNLAINTCQEIRIDGKISCDAELGESICAEAVITPESDCSNIINPEWSGAFLQVTGECDNDKVKFTIENSGTGDMAEPSGYIIIEDEVVLMARPATLLLKSGETKEVNYEANGSTYTLKLDQAPNFPGKSNPLLNIEGCGVNDDGTFSKGFVTQFAQDDESNMISIDCNEVVGSWDPNDKVGYPFGYGEEHFIDLGQALNYRIRFQNTGTDTAFTVVIKDVISEDLDITTLNMGIGSHPYQYTINNDTLIVSFLNIELPDSTTNEVASHGFIKFKISQQPDLEIGTVIENTASIYFDFNEAVVTNTTTHKIGIEYYKIVSVDEPLISGLSVDISPNPFDQETTISLKGIDFKEAEVKLFNMNGTLLRKQEFTSDRLIVSGNGLVSGVYYFKIQVDGVLAVNGKLIMQ